MTLSPGLAEEDPPGQPRVLLVDDDEVNLLLTSIALRERGFSITEATSGERAIQVLADWLPDVVVLDALMPGMDGFQTCRELRALPGFESLPVLMLTGLDDDASINRAYEVGATDFFVKSTHWSLLAGRLRYLLRSSRTRLELERSKSKLARAQDLARMGSFDWKRDQGSRAARSSRSRACACSASARARRSSSGPCCGCCRRKTAAAS
jgi:PleD family two-component response regulator